MVSWLASGVGEGKGYPSALPPLNLSAPSAARTEPLARSFHARGTAEATLEPRPQSDVNEA